MAKILEVLARSVWDSRGRATVEAEIAVKGARGRAIARVEDLLQLAKMVANHVKQNKPEM